jgi:hypothetical protein
MLLRLTPLRKEPESQTSPNGSLFEYIIVLVFVFALFVLAVFASLDGIYVVKSGKSIADQRRRPAVSITAMNASQYHLGMHFPVCRLSYKAVEA